MAAQFVMGHERDSAGLLEDYAVVDSPPPVTFRDTEWTYSDSEDESEDEEAVLGDHRLGEAVDPEQDGGDADDDRDDDEEETAEVDHEAGPEEEHDDEDLFESDGSDDESDGDDELMIKTKNGEAAAVAGTTTAAAGTLFSSQFVPEGKFLGPAEYASFGSTAGFIRVAAAEADPAGGQEIVVLYRYTRYSRTWSGRRGVDVCRRTKQHRLRFVVPPAGDPASSLPWAGSALAPLIYPSLYSDQLQGLWSRLVAPLSIPPRATRLEVMVDVGILRAEDKTPERMEHMRGELEAKKEEAWPGYHIGMELNLPEPVLCKRVHEDDDSDDSVLQPAKRRRVVVGIDGEECPICLETLESGLAAWPGCSVPHVFHGDCLEQTLRESERCPICRRDLGLKNLSNPQ